MVHGQRSISRATVLDIKQSRMPPQLHKPAFIYEVVAARVAAWRNLRGSNKPTHQPTQPNQPNQPNQPSRNMPASSRTAPDQRRADPESQEQQGLLEKTEEPKNTKNNKNTKTDEEWVDSIWKQDAFSGEPAATKTHAEEEATAKNPVKRDRVDGESLMGRDIWSSKKCKFTDSKGATVPGSAYNILNDPMPVDLVRSHLQTLRHMAEDKERQDIIDKVDAILDMSDTLLGARQLEICGMRSLGMEPDHTVYLEASIRPTELASRSV